MKKPSKDLYFKIAVSTTGRLVIITVLSLPLLLLYNSVPILGANSLFELIFSNWNPDERIYGIGSFIYTSVLTSAISSVSAFFISLSVSLYVYFRRNTFVGKLLYKAVKVMSGIPTVVYGFAGIMVIVPLVRNMTPSSSGLCLFSVIIVVTVLIIPTIAMYMISGLELVPEENVTAGLSLGADENQLFCHILLPAVRKYFAVAFILGFSRAIGDTMVALMISGNSLRFPTSVFQSARNVTSHIAILIPGEFSGIEFKAVFFSSLVIIIIVIFLNFVVTRLERNK